MQEALLSFCLLQPGMQYNSLWRTLNFGRTKQWEYDTLSFSTSENNFVPSLTLAVQEYLSGSVQVNQLVWCLTSRHLSLLPSWRCYLTLDPLWSFNGANVFINIWCMDI